MEKIVAVMMMAKADWESSNNFLPKRARVRSISVEISIIHSPQVPFNYIFIERESPAPRLFLPPPSGKKNKELDFFLAQNAEMVAKALGGGKVESIMSSLMGRHNENGGSGSGSINDSNIVSTTNAITKNNKDEGDDISELFDEKEAKCV